MVCHINSGDAENLVHEWAERLDARGVKAPEGDGDE